MESMYCEKCKDDANVYYNGKWYIACECTKTGEYKTRQEAIDAWDSGNYTALPKDVAE